MTISVQQFAKELINNLYVATSVQQSPDGNVELTIPSRVDPTAIHPTLKEIGGTLGNARLLRSFSFEVYGGDDYPQWWQAAAQCCYDLLGDGDDMGAQLKFLGGNHYEIQTDADDEFVECVMSFQSQLPKYLSTRVDVESSNGVTTVTLRNESDLDAPVQEMPAPLLLPVSLDMLDNLYKELVGLCNNLKARQESLVTARTFFVSTRDPDSLTIASSIIDTALNFHREAQSLMDMMGRDHPDPRMLEDFEIRSERFVEECHFRGHFQLGETRFFNLAEDTLLEAIQSHAKVIAALSVAEVQTVFRQKYPG